MRPMELKEPTRCCGVQTLLWIKEKQRFMCPCGQMIVSESGHQIGRANFDHFFPKKKKDETANQG